MGHKTSFRQTAKGLPSWQQKELPIGSSLDNAYIL